MQEKYVYVKERGSIFDKEVKGNINKIIDKASTLFSKLSFEEQEIAIDIIRSQSLSKRLKTIDNNNMNKIIKSIKK